MDWELTQAILRNSLYEFVQAAWEQIESNPYIDGRHIKAVSDHLQACYEDKITDLIINIPPGCSKSLVACVFFPAWVWTKSPEKRFFFSSYDAQLSSRDSAKCRVLLETEWYQSMFPGMVKFSKDQNQKTFYQNTAGGWRMASSVGGHGTGVHPHYVVCLPYNSLVRTDKGVMQIGDIVESRLDVMIASHNHCTGEMEWKRIEAHEKSLGRKCLRLSTSNGHIDLTPNHPVMIQGRGYVRADEVHIGDEVVYDRGLSWLQRSIREQENAVLQSGVLLPIEEECQHDAMHRLQRDVLSLPLTYQEKWEHSREILFKRVQQPASNKSESSCIQGKDGAELQGVREINAAQVVPISVNILFSPMPGGGSKEEARQVGLSYMCQATYTPRATSEKKEDLQQRMCLNRSSTKDGWEEQPTLGSWESRRGIQQRLQEDSKEDTPERRKRLYVVQDNEADLQQGIGCSPHQLQQGRRFGNESDNAVQVVPRQDAWITEKPGYLATQVVTSVTESVSPEYVYNVRIEGNHNYFANGFLVHNCDDGNNAKQAESPVERQSVADWWKLTMSSRGVTLGVKKIVIQQRLHQEDLTGVCLEMGGYEHLCLPMRYEGARPATSIGFVDWRTEEGELLAPKQFNEETVRKLEANLGEYGSAGQLQQRPVPRQGGMFHVDKIEIVDAAPALMKECRYWDTASSAGKGDYTAGVRMGKDVKSGIYYIMDVVRGQWSSDERKRIQRQTADMDYAYPICINVPQIQSEDPGSAGKDQSADFIRLMSGHTAECIRETGAKETRADPFSSQVNAGNVKMVKAGWNKAYIDELRLFPFGKNDDMVDSSAGGFNWLENKNKVEFLPSGWSFGGSI